jgi:branched-chain amino acid transport system ATP-binding protein
MLSVTELTAGYGGSDVLHRLSFSVARGEACALVGANGAGKSTALKTLAGLIRASGGEVRLDGEAITRAPAARILRKGLALVPEGRRVFGPLSVRENLQMGAFTRLFPRRQPGVDEQLEFVLETFPRLRERLAQQAGTLSGGEQQMLAIGRALMSSPRVLLLDEPSMGLAPRVVEQVFEVLASLREAGLTVVVSEQNARVALAWAERGHVIEAGRIVHAGSAAELRSDERVREAYLGV